MSLLFLDTMVETPTLPGRATNSAIFGALRCFEAFKYFSSGIRCFEDWSLPLFQWHEMSLVLFTKKDRKKNAPFSC